MDRLFEESYVRTPTGWAPAGERGCNLAMDVYMTDEDLVLIAAGPGMPPEDVDITLAGDTLTLKGEIKAPLENVNYVIQERPFGKFQRTLRLNIPVQAEKAEASFERGILTLTVPKQEKVKPRTIEVKTK
jgi:HSP20 family protein